jgi:hypothetical protein
MYRHSVVVATEFGKYGLGYNTVMPPYTQTIQNRERRQTRLTDAQARDRVKQHSPYFLPNPDVPFPGSREPWIGTDSRCGKTVSPTLLDLRHGYGCCDDCSPTRQLTDEQAATNRRQERDSR